VEDWNWKTTFTDIIGLYSTTETYLASKAIEGVAPTNHSFSRKTGLNDLPYGMKISKPFSSVLSQCTRLTNKQTDGRTDGQT